MSAFILATRKLTDRLPLLALLAATFAFLYFRFEKLFKCPSCYLFSDGGDGLKNYFTAAYYVRDDGLWFNGMNYPYGEHPVYTDNQPIWSLAMKFVNLFHPMERDVIGTMNMLLVISLAVAVIAIYFLLRELNLPRWYAALVSLPIVFLSPQLERFNGHYSLAYVCYLPIFLLLFLRWHKHHLSLKYALGLLVFIIWIGFTHLYFFFIAVAFMIAYCFVLWVHKKFKWENSFTRILALVVVTGIVIYLPVKLTDPFKDRPQEVYGIYVFAATPVGTFLPWYGNWAKTWTEKYGIKAPDFESHTYLGIAGILLFPFIFFNAIRTLLSRRRRQLASTAESDLAGVIAWTVFLIWIMATGWFYMAGGKYLIKAFPVIGQFRSLGRLAWIVYYGYLCFAAWFVYTLIGGLQKRWLRFSLTGLAALLYVTWAYEAFGYSEEATKQIYHSNTVFRGEKPFLDVLATHALKPEDFQAILQVPLIIIGTENLPVHRGHWEFNNTLQCAWETGLPIVNYNMSRTSVSSALSLLQLISTPDIPKVRLQDMNNKPLLLTAYPAQLLPTERRLVELADSLGTVNDMSVYKLDISAFDIPMAADTKQRITLLHEGFEHTPATHALEGSGSFTCVKNTVFASYTDTADASHQITFSCWVYIAADVPGFPAIQVKQYSPDGTQIDEQVYSIHSFHPWQVRGNWVEVTFPLLSKVRGVRYDISTLSNDSWIDEAILWSEEL